MVRLYGTADHTFFLVKYNSPDSTIRKIMTWKPMRLRAIMCGSAAFLEWAAEPHMMARKRIGFQVMIFLIVLSGLLYFTKKKVWSAVH